jgi:hypothetical protein
MVTKYEGGREGHSNSGSWRTRFFCNLNVSFLCKQSISIFACYSFIGDVMMNRWSGVKMFFSVITVPIVLAHLIDFLIRRCHVHPQWLNIHPANLIRLAYSRYYHVQANTIGIVNVHILTKQNNRWETDLVLFAKICNASPIRGDNAYL